MSRNLPCVNVALGSEDRGYSMAVRHALDDVARILEESIDLDNLDYFRAQLALVNEHEAQLWQEAKAQLLQKAKPTKR